MRHAATIQSQRAFLLALISEQRSEASRTANASLAAANGALADRHREFRLVARELETKIETGLAPVQASADTMQDLAVSLAASSQRSAERAYEVANQAARAGPVGSGFAVVAAEVRTLADQTQLDNKDVRISCLLAGSCTNLAASVSGTHPAVVVGHPASGVKERTTGLYASKLACRKRSRTVHCLMVT